MACPQRKKTEVNILTIYVRPGGSDGWGNGSEKRPYATLRRALQAIPRRCFARYVIDITGVKETTDNHYEFPILHASGLAVFDTDKAGELDARSAPLIIKADPKVIDTFEPSNQTIDPVTKLKTLHHADASWVPGEHVGRIVLGKGVLQAGVVASNTETTLEVTSNLDFEGAVSILEPSAEIAYTGDYYTGVVMQPQTQMVFSGISFRHSGTRSSSVSVWVAGSTKCVFVGCWFEGINTESHVLSDACWFRGNKDHWVAGDEHRTRFCLFTNQHLRIYGTGARGTQGPYACILDGCTPAGHGGNNESHSSFEIVSCHVRNVKGAGIIFQGGSRCSVRNSRIDAPVVARGSGVLDLINVAGDAGAGHGAHLEQGACINVGGTVTLAGSLGEADLGGAGATAWSDAPAGDFASSEPQGCFLYRS